jgi:hypothetical protein
MKQHPFRLIGLVLVFALIFSGIYSTIAGDRRRSLTVEINPEASSSIALPESSSPLVKSSQGEAAVAQAFGQMPLIFIQNQGQMDSRVAYYIQGQDTSVYFASEGLTFALSAPLEDKISSSHPAFLSQRALSRRRGDLAEAGRWILKLDFLGARGDVLPQGEVPAETVVSYFKGSREDWHTGLPTFQRLVYHNLWDGIDLVYSGTVDRLKYEFVVQPGADPYQIRLAYRGANGLKLDDLGQMEVSTPVGSLKDEAPNAYQVVGGEKRSVTVSYEIQDAGRQPREGRLVPDAEKALPYSFQVSAYDPALPLVIDPAIQVPSLAYCGYIGGGGYDYGNAIAVDGSGAVYVTGYTNSDQTTFPVSVGPDLTFTGSDDAFVAKISPDGRGLIYAGYIAGSQGNSIAVEDGEAYITGVTYASETIFPVTIGPDLIYNGGEDAFVAKVRADGTGLVYAGYIGGGGALVNWDYGYGIAVDNSGAAYVTGQTGSDPATFPLIGGPDLTFNGGGNDTFVAKVRPDGSELVYCGYIGGNDFDAGFDIAVDDSGAAYVTGRTKSYQATFPIIVGPDLTYSDDYYGDAFVAKVLPDGSGLVYCGYVGGGGGIDSGYAIDIDGSGAVYIVGDTQSDQTTFPVIGGPDLTYNGGSYDAFVAKVRPDGSGLEYDGFIGGSGSDSGYGIAVDGSGAAYVTGRTSSTQTTFPVSGGPDLTYNGGSYDAFVAKVRPDGSGLVYAGFIGGSEKDYAISIVIDTSGSAYVIGDTQSDQATFPVSIGPDLTYNGGTYDAFIAKIAILVLSSNVYLPAIIK